MNGVNNLLYAHKVGQTKAKEVGKQIDPALWVPLEKLGAYFVEKGQIRDIIDPELGLIQAEMIDSASQLINEEYDNLLDLDEDLS